MLVFALIKPPQPIPKAPAECALIAKQRFDLPIRHLFATGALDLTHIRAFTFDDIVDNVIIWDRFLTIWTNKLVGHRIAFLRKLLTLL